MPSHKGVNLKNEILKCMAITSRSGKVIGDVPSIIDVVVGIKAKASFVDNIIDVDDVEEVQTDATPTFGNSTISAKVEEG